MKKVIFAAALSALALPAYGDVTINGKISTLGGGAEVAFPLLSSLDARLGFNSSRNSIQETITSNGVATDWYGDLNLQSLQAFVDWHPFNGSFRLSGGVVHNGNEFSLTGRPTGGSINIGGIPYQFPASAAVNTTIDFNKVAPYFGIGWGRTPGNTGFSFTSDIGVMFQGSLNATVTATGIPDTTGTLAADVARAEADLENRFKNYRFYPVISLGIGYTF